MSISNINSKKKVSIKKKEISDMPNITNTIPTDNKTNKTFIEVCAGAGGLSSGLIKAGFVPLLLNDIDKNCCKTLEKNHPGSNIICDSLLNMDLSQYKGKVDLLANGSPCQSYSLSGERKGLEDPRGELMIKFVKLIEAIEPKIFLIENVKGLLSHNNGKTIKNIITTLNRQQKYNVDYKLLNSVNYGVPQKRERVFIIGCLKSKNIRFEYPLPDTSIITLGKALQNVPNSQGASYPDKKKTYFNLIPEGGCWVDLPEDKQREYLMSSFNSKGGKRGILRRLSMNEPSLTLLCTPSQKQTERCHPLEIRPLTIREYARIQTFPDDYIFTGSLTSQYKQIGNAVPVELANRIGLAIKKALQ